MPGARAADLTEIADVFHRRTFVSRQMKERIDQHRTVSGRQHEAVPIGPAGGLGIMLEILAPQHGRHIGHTHRHSRMP